MPEHHHVPDEHLSPGPHHRASDDDRPLPGPSVVRHRRSAGRTGPRPVPTDLADLAERYGDVDALEATDPDADTLDGLPPDQRWSTWSAVERGQRGPEPRPAWVVTADAAIDTDLGVLKTGKEADVFLVERAVPDDPTRTSLLAAKRYRDLDHRAFRRDTVYTETRTVRRSRDQRALSKRSAYGREVASGQWAMAEFEALSRLWEAGAPVPYPVQVDGTEILMEFVAAPGGEPHEAAPRLARLRPDPDLLEVWWAALRDAMTTLARAGFAHGDLSPYNVLAADDRLVLIDLPQVVDVVANPFGSELLLRDCRTMCTWFRSRGLDADPDQLFATLLAEVW